MPGAEFSKVISEWINGALRFMTPNREDLLVVGATTGVPFGAYYQTVSTITAATSLTAIHCGKLVTCATDDVVITLPTAATIGLNYNVMNTGSDGAALLVVKTAATTDVIQGYGSAATTGCAIKNTKATQRVGDSVGLMASGSVTWYLTNVVGTWALSTTS